MSEFKIEPIAHIHTPFSQKFGIPRQSGLVDNECVIIFEKKYRSADAVRGLEGYSHLWLIWQFSESVRTGFSPTVRPPRLGGNTRVGVFATRSPFRPNSLGLSSVRMSKIEYDEKNGPMIYVIGADILDNTPVFDIKPYLPYTDSHNDATVGLNLGNAEDPLTVEFKCRTDCIDSENLKRIKTVLSLDPRPHYQDDPERIYGLDYSGYGIRFTVRENILTVVSVFNSPNIDK